MTNICSKRGQDRAKGGPRGPKMGPRRAKGGPRWPQGGKRGGQEGPKRTQGEVIWGLRGYFEVKFGESTAKNI